VEQQLKWVAKAGVVAAPADCHLAGRARYNNDDVQRRQQEQQQLKWRSSEVPPTDIWLND